MDPKKIAFREKVLSRRNLCGTHIAVNCPVFTELLASVGFDFLWIDTEHNSIDPDDLLRHISAAELGGTPSLVRVQMHDRNQVKRVLEMGPCGVIFPMISTREEADAAMSWTLYPPRGVRGFGPLRSVRYGLREIDDYLEYADRELCRFIQIETAEAVRNLPEIVKNPDIDGYIFGPCDLSGSIGELNNVFGAKTQALIREAVAILRDNGKCIGVSTGSPDPEVTGFWHSLGINMISSGVDFDYLIRGARENLKNLRTLQQP